MNFYQRLADLREDHDLKQEDIAKIINSARQQISKYERGLQMMGIDKYIALAKYYNISLDYICGLIDTPAPLTRNETKQTTRKKAKKAIIEWTPDGLIIKN